MKALWGLGAALVAFSAAAAPYRLGMSQSQCGTTGGCYVTAYYDGNRNTGALRDWACGTKTYDNHSGTDVGIGGFTSMDRGRDVLAAADGTVIGAHDGEFDRCTSGSCGQANYVWIKHADGQVSLYYHLKKGSVAVAVGQKVTCGQKLGQVGSSGYSTGPHLHFQVNLVQGSAGSHDDPYAGTTAACGGPVSWWIQQGAYKGLPGFACPVPPAPDLVVQSVSVAPSAPRDGEGVKLTAVVKNQGTAQAAAGLRVAFKVDGLQVGTAQLPVMAALATATVSTPDAAWQATSGPHVVSVVADDLGAAAESSETNNSRNLSLRVAGVAVLATAAVEGTLEPVKPEGAELPVGPVDSGPLGEVPPSSAEGPAPVVGNCGCGSVPANGAPWLLALLALRRRR